VEADHVELFDRGRGTRCTCSSMCTATAATAARPWWTCARPTKLAGLFLAPGELPDHLTVVLEYASTQPPVQARAFLGEIAHILQVIFSALLRARPLRQRAGRVARPGRREGQAVKCRPSPS
jgi:nitrate reductase delta subunit